MRFLIIVVAALLAMICGADRAEADEALSESITCEACPTFLRVPTNETFSTTITHVAKHELTWNQYLAAFDSGACPLPPLYNRRFQPFTIDSDDALFSEFRRDYAISNLRPSDVQCYVDWLASRIGMTVRLPTYREWEWFARSGREKRKYPWGNEADPTREALTREYILHILAQPRADRVTEVRVSHIILGTRVGLFPPTEWGLHDLLGNVPELTSDVIDPSNVEIYRKELGIPINPEGGRRRIIKGEILAGRSDYWRAGISKTQFVRETDNAFSFAAGVRLVLEQ